MVSASSLLLPSSVRDLASCVSDGAVRVACTTPASTLTVSTSSSSSPAPPSTLSVAVTYRATPQAPPPSSPPQLLRLTWSRSPHGPSTLSFAGPAASCPAVLLRRRKGTCCLPTSSSSAHSPTLALFWDLTAARYDGAASASSSSSSPWAVTLAARARAPGRGRLPRSPEDLPPSTAPSRLRWEGDFEGMVCLHENKLQ